MIYVRTEWKGCQFYPVYGRKKFSQIPRGQEITDILFQNKHSTNWTVTLKDSRVRGWRVRRGRQRIWVRYGFWWTKVYG